MSDKNVKGGINRAKSLTPERRKEIASNAAKAMWANHGKATGKLRMTDDQQVTLWLGALRYYMGRMTYAVSDFVELTIQQWKFLPKRAQILMHRDLKEEYDLHFRDTAEAMEIRGRGRLGMQCDVDAWQKLLTHMQENMR